MSSNRPTEPAGRLRLWPTTLSGRLVLTSIVLVAAVSVLVAIATTLALRSFLFQRLDNQLEGFADRYEGSHTPDTGGPDEPVPIPDPCAPTGGRVENPRAQVGSLGGFIGQGCAHAEVVDAQGYLQPVSADTVARLGSVPYDATPHTVGLPGLGSYRVVAVRVGDVIVVAGLPTSDVEATLGRLMGWEALLILAAVAVGALVARSLVHRQLRPLRAVAATAATVTRTPLDRGAVGTTARVPEEYTRPDNEVGQLGEALNLMLGHVERALDARHESEQQVRQFLADASHELRTPLSTIAGYAELSRRTPPDDPEADAQALRHAMNRVDVESGRMTALVDDLLLLARLDAGRPLESGPVDLSRLTVEALADARIVGADHQWRLDLPGVPVLVRGDAGRLHQVVANLLSNAWRHTPAGSTISVGLAVDVSAHDLSAHDGVRLTVHDDGPGLPDALQSHAFERFTRGDSSRTRDTGGSGLGLPIVAAIVHAHDGTVDVESRPGDTTFTVRLPGAVLSETDSADGADGDPHSTTTE